MRTGDAVIFLNGRFLDQAMTGVQRFAVEITMAIDSLAAQGEWPETVILTPPTCAEAEQPFRSLHVRCVGKTRGHVWEQTELPGTTRRGVLISLGNTAPVLAGRRQIVVIHDAGVFDTPESYSLKFRTWYKALQWGLARTGVRIATVSEFSRQRIAARLDIDPAGIAILSEGADHIVRVPPETETLHRYGLASGRYALVVASRAAHKNLDILQGAAELLRQRGMDIAVAGGGNAQVFRDVGDRSSEMRLGRVSDGELRALYQHAVCLLFPSRYEGFGLPPVEAMACGCPVVAVGGGAVEEICRNGALYFPTDNGSALARAVTRLLDEPGLATALRANGLARASGLSWEASARALGKVVKTLH